MTLIQIVSHRTSSSARRRWLGGARTGTAAHPGIEPLERRELMSIIPKPDHVVIVVEENHGYSQIIGSSAAPYINSLAQQGASFTQSYGVTHPSQPNYLDLFSGSNQGKTTDIVPTKPLTTPNLGSELIQAGYTFGGYSQGLPAVGSLVNYSGSYARKHNPWSDWQGASANAIPGSDNMPFKSFPTNFDALPTVSLVVPDLLHDMHSGSIATGDTWLRAKLDGYVQWAKTHNSLLVVTFDEGSGAVNRIPTIFVGPMVQPGQYDETIKHFNVLRTVEDMYGLPYAGASANAAPITDVWVNNTVNNTYLSIGAPATLTAGATYSDQGTAWRDPGFNDSTWKSGPARLGYGDAGEATVLAYGPDPLHKYITTYFRRAFTVADASEYASLGLGLTRDDGAVVYLNSTEVFRSNMPAGVITYQTRASTTVGGTAESTVYHAIISSSALVDGTNVLAVEIHQSSGSSSDIRFDLSLSAT